MEADVNIEATRIYYNSIYRHEVDEKRRVQIPAKWRPAQPGTELTLVLWRKDKEGPCLRVLPPEQMAKLMSDIVALPNDNQNKTVLKRLIGTDSVQVTLDKVGRITLPDEMARAAGITNKAVLVGCLDRYEIWSPERHMQKQAADAFMASEALKMME